MKMDDSSIRRHIAFGSLVIGFGFSCGAFAQAAEQASDDDERLQIAVSWAPPSRGDRGRGHSSYSLGVTILF